MIAGGTMIADIALFSDHAYIYLAIVGAFVSMFGVLHEIFGRNAKEYNIKRAVSEIIKGFFIGILAIPFWYLTITEGVLKNITGIDIGSVSCSLALIISFALSWYTVPIFDWISYSIKRKVK